MAIEVTPQAFGFPNFLNLKELDDKLPVHMLSDEQAAAYWDDMKPLWLAHVAQKRNAQRIAEQQQVKAWLDKSK